MENKSCSSSRWSKNFGGLHRRNKINKSFGANDVEMESTYLQIINSDQVRIWNNSLIMIKTVEIEYSIIPDSLNLENNTTKNGEFSCSFFEICENTFPLQNTQMQGNNCNHRYCEECIQNYIDCTGTLVDDLRGYPIRECFEC
ncbi:hypothetical protein H5410_015185 [Solanum commersonii]|uniref:RING-type domain-containing protein n=1 Tax=Solanum commersonii TaxID=4109 RepID=A0A9J5ZT39_SOLCO|nr:hypothetical protein H5410_015185 [Solanum commersonii]